MFSAVTSCPKGAPATSSAVAVIGMAGRFPGAGSVEALWSNLRDGIESIHAFTDEELLAAGDTPDRLRDPAYVKASGRLADIDKFDASFFGLSPRDAAVFDPQQRLFLECAWEAFEDAGYVAEKVAGPVSVFASSGASEYMMKNLASNRRIMESLGPWLVRHTGNDANFLATRVSYELNLHGPSMSVQSACSSSLLAVHLACQSLLNGECDMALAGGSTVYSEQDRGYFYREGEILSPDGHCRAFDAGAGGTVMASAVGCVVLKRLDDALRDGDRVLASVLGSAVNNDGADKVGYLAPSVAGQARVVSEALAVAGVDAEDVSYIEAHGTGTPVGDPIEIKALTEAFRATTQRRQFCAIGSLKTNIGHSGEAAGICSLIKTVLALVHRQIPASLHFRSANPQLELATSPFFVNDSLRDWTAPPGKRRVAGVTALGVGGTNVHLLVEGCDPLGQEVGAGTGAGTDAGPAQGPHLLLLSAKTSNALEQASIHLGAYLRSQPDSALADVTYTLLAGRKSFSFRRAIVANDAGDAADALENGDTKRVATQRHNGDSPSVAFMLPGGGAQYAGMGAELYATEAVYRESVEACLSSLAEPLAATVRDLLLAPANEAVASERLKWPSLTLPALFATEYAVAKLLESWGITPTALIGHSAGEYAAACLAQVVAPSDAMALVALRGRLFETLPEGSMLSIALAEEEARTFLTEGVCLGAVNGPSLCVASGPALSVGRMEAALRARRVACTRVPFRVAAHSAMVEPILTEFTDFCRTIAFHPPRTPFVSNLTGTWITDAEAMDPVYWARHLRETVRFHEGIRRL
ncbi:MAG: type I polyketide synthase, partial [Polyangiaceae bacterium]